jgi:PAS domain S-box-containing protein
VRGAGGKPVITEGSGYLLRMWLHSDEDSGEMSAQEPVNILLVDDKPAKLLSYEAILSELGENLITAGSAKDALEQILKREIAVVLTDVRMPELDGFELAGMIREHPRFENIAIVFISASQLTEVDRLRGYKSGAVDYITVPFVPELLRAKVKVFADLYRKTRQLEQMNAELERRVAKRTAALTASMERLRESEAQFRAVFNQQFQYMALLSPEGRVMEVNDLPARATGVPREAVLGQLFWDTPWWNGLPEMRAAWPGRLAAAAHADGPVFSEGQYLADGEVRTAASTLTAVKSADGQVKFFIFEASDITERRRAEQARRRSEALASAVLASALDAVVIVDHRGMVVEWNRAAEGVFGYKRTDAIGQEMAELIIPPRLRAAHRRGLADYLVSRAGPVLGRLIELPALRADGGEFPVELYIAPIPIEGPPLFTGFARDITERKAAEAALKESEARLRLFVEGAPAGIAMFDRDMRYIAVSRRFAHDYQLAEKDLIGRSHYEIFPEVPARWREIHRRCLAGETLRCDEDQFPRTDGRTDWVRWEMRPWRGAGGDIGGVILFSEVITQRKVAEAALKESEERLRFVTERAKVGHWDWDIPSGRLNWSATCKRLFGIPEAETVTHERFLAMLHADDRTRVDQAVQACLKGRGDTDYDIEYRTLWPDGTLRWIHARGSAIFEEGRPVRMAGIALDVTERKLSEEHVRFVMTELSHRTKNLMAVVQAIAWQTAQRAASLADFDENFTQRLEALARSHDLLVKRKWQGVVLEDLVCAQLEPFLDRSKNRIAAHGPDLLLMPEAAQDLGLALHELATNASKYGALSVPTGRIDIAWTVADDMNSGAKRFIMTWRETGGPVVTRPIRKGFGSRVITSALAGAFNGQAILEYNPEGLSWELAAPVGRLFTEVC